MFQESPFSGVCAYATLEVILMLVGTLLLGLLLGYLIWGWTRRKLRETEAQLASLAEANTSLKQKLDEFDIADQENKSELAKLQSTVASHTSLINSLKNQLNDEQSRAADLEKVLEEVRTSTPEVSEPESPSAEIAPPGQMSKAYSEAFPGESPETREELPDLESLATASKVFGKEIIFNDLSVIEGIGPKISEVLERSGITSWKQLSVTTRHILRVILDEAGSQFRGHVPKTWPRQARMAANGEWKKLKAYQDILIGGK